MHRAFKLVGQTTLEHPRSKSLMCRRCDRGPPFSVQLSRSRFPAGAVSIVHPIRIDPAALDNAPYFTAFVASSLKEMLSAKAAFGGKRIFSPVITMRSARPPET